MSRIVIWIVRHYYLLTAWLSFAILGALIPPFLLIMVLLFLSDVATRPVVATGRLIVGWVIGLFVLFVSYRLLSDAHLRYAMSQQASK
jgi:hypothetical protein